MTTPLFLEEENTQRPTLGPKDVTINRYEIAPVKNINKEKITFYCKHPDKTEEIALSKVRYIKENKFTTSGTWVTLNKEGQLQRNSALGQILVHYKAKILDELKTLKTTLGDNGYLVIKAYD